MNYHFLILLTVFAFTSVTVNGEKKVNVTYGSATDGTNGSIFTNQAGTGFNSATKAVLAYGWSDGFALSGTFNDHLTNFNVIGWTNFNSVNSGYLPATAEFDNDNVQAAGKVGYLMVLAGIENFNDSASATEYAIIGHTSWSTAPSCLP